jgi:hypothetical protein
MALPVKIFGLQTGEQVLGQVVAENMDNGTCTIKNPAVLVPAGQGKLALVPWLPYAEYEDGVSVRGVLFSVVPTDGLLKEYNTGFVSGLVVPSTKVEAPTLKIVT